ncbi:MAG: phosphotransferase, partial [Chloroflexota bacterium]
EAAYNITIETITGMPQGTGDSKFKVGVQEIDSPLVLTIHETPTISPAGKPIEVSQRVLYYLSYLRDATQNLTDDWGNPINLNILPLQKAINLEKEPPYILLPFDNEEKPVSLVPFINGKYFINSAGELVTTQEVFLAGRALAAYSKVAQHYPKAHQFTSLPFEHFVNHIADVTNKEQIWERLGYILSNRKNEGPTASRLGQAYLAEMHESGQRLLAAWDHIQNNQDIFLQALIHGDFFTDNAIISNKQEFFMIDFSHMSQGPIGIDLGISLNSWASQEGVPHMTNVIRFLQGVNSVTPLTTDLLTMIPTFAQLAAFRWETFRIQFIMEKDLRHHPARSPEEFQRLRQAWQTITLDQNTIS